MDVNGSALVRSAAFQPAVPSVLERESWRARRRRLRLVKRLRDPRSRRQFSLATMFRWVTAISVLFWICLVLLPGYVNWLLNGRAQERLAILELGAMGGQYGSFLHGYKIDLSVDAIARTTELRKRAPISDVSFIPLPVSNDRLSCLQRIPRVAILDLRGQPITDAGLVHVKRLRNLLKLDLRGTQVTDAAAAELRKSLPDCKVIW